MCCEAFRRNSHTGHSSGPAGCECCPSRYAVLRCRREQPRTFKRRNVGHVCSFRWWWWWWRGIEDSELLPTYGIRVLPILHEYCEHHFNRSCSDLERDGKCVGCGRERRPDLHCSSVYRSPSGRPDQLVQSRSSGTESRHHYHP